MKYFFCSLIILFVFGHQDIYSQGVTYSQGPNLNDARVGDHGVVLNDGRVLILGGHGTGFVKLNSAEIWDASSNAFTKFTMNDYRDYCAVVKLQNGKYLLAGGMSSNLGVGQLSTMEIFNPTDNSFTPAANMSKVRTWARGAQLTGGKVLIVGCWYNNESAMQGDLYDPISDTCIATGDMTAPRSNSFVLPMDDGSALVFGGNSTFGSANYEQIDLYNPSSNSFSLFQDKLLPMDTLWFPIYSLYDIAESYKMADGKYIMLAAKNSVNRSDYKLFTVDPATKTIDTFSVTPSIPYYDYLNPDSTSIFSPVLDKANNKLYLFSIKIYPGTEAFKVSTIDLTTHQLFFASGFISVPYLFHDTPRLLLNDGRMFVAGGSVSDNFDPVNSSFFLTIQPTDVKNEVALPGDFSLSQNYPNPFNPSTMIKYSLPYEGNVKLLLYNSIGQLVKTLMNSSQSAGVHEFNLNSPDLSSGVYFYSINVSSSEGNVYRSTKKMLLLK